MNLLFRLKKALFGCPSHLYNPWDFSRFYDQYAPMVYGHLLDRTQDAPLAESMLADVFLTLWRERQAFNENQSGPTPQAPFSWLLGIVHQKERQNSLVG